MDGLPHPSRHRAPERPITPQRARARRAVSGRVVWLALLALAAACGPGDAARQRPLDFLFTAPAPGVGFQHVSSYDTTGGNADRRVAPAGDSVVLLDMDGPGVVRRLWITVASSDPDYLRRIALKMYWDGETNPSVEAPLGDFFGNGFDTRHYTALPMGMSSGGFYCTLPMPFAKHARIVAVNGTGRTISAVYFNLDLTTGDQLPHPLETFHAWWHRDRRTTRPTPHLVLDAAGQGRFIGLSLNAESYNNQLWFLEGDEIWHVDGRFRGQGTGTEDYFNSGWYFNRGPFAGPYHGLIIKNDSLGRIAAYRWQIPDAVPFHDSIRVEIEHGAENQEVADYATMAYWYQVEPHRPLPPLPPPDARRVLGVKIPPDAVPVDSLPVAQGPGGTLTLRVPVPRPDRYEMVVYARARAGRDTLRLALRPAAGAGPGTSPGAATASRTAGRHGGGERVLDLSAEEPGRILAPASLGTAGLAGHDVDLELGGPAVAALGHATSPEAAARALLAAVDLRPVRVWAREWNVVGPFANPRVPGSDRSPALDSVYGPERDPGLSRHYSGVDGARVTWQRATAGDDGFVNLDDRFQPNDHVAAYARAFLVSPDARDATLLLGADDADQLWVNGQEVSSRQGPHASQPDEMAVPVHLHAGCNLVVLKVAELEGGWGFQMRAADPAGDLRWRAGGCR
ncbi:MAG TPA: DUF2961 domain-containing protein [Longimicrobiales bacterium]|nr:DUF2961 domain-containing protein [Longimicrobiales bacterium]